MEPEASSPTSVNPILRQIIPVYIITSYFFKINFNIIFQNELFQMMVKKKKEKEKEKEEEEEEEEKKKKKKKEENETDIGV
jgi:uncharacterized protein YacL